jgi:hypothetical protein
MDANGASKTATPWGAAKLIDELTLPQRAGEKRFASVVQLLEAPRGERLVRFAYSTGGRRGAGRSPCVYATSSACEQRLRSIPTWRRCCALGG